MHMLAIIVRIKHELRTLGTSSGQKSLLQIVSDVHSKAINSSSKMSIRAMDNFRFGHARLERFENFRE